MKTTLKKKLKFRIIRLTGINTLIGRVYCNTDQYKARTGTNLAVQINIKYT